MPPVNKALWMQQQGTWVQRLGYDGTNFWDHEAESDGDLSLTPSTSGKTWRLSDAGMAVGAVAGAPDAGEVWAESVRVGVDGLSSATAGIELVTLDGLDNGLGNAATKGWLVGARSDAYTTTADQNDWLLSFWDGSAWSPAMEVDSVTRQVTIEQNLVVKGNLTVDGTGTEVITESLNVEDAWVTVNSDVTGTPSEDAYFQVERGTSTNARLTWNETSDEWRAGIAGSEAKIWTAGNDGPASGLNADLLDGSHASAFASASHVHAAGDITSGVLPVARGGTGTTTFTDGEFLMWDTGTGDIISSGFGDADFAAAGHTHAAGDITSGTLSVSRGGTGVGTLTGIPVGSGTSAFTSVSGTASQVLRRNTGNTAYEFVSLSGGGDPLGTGRTLTGGTGINALGDLSADRTVSIDTSVVPRKGEAETITGSWTFEANPRLNAGQRLVDTASPGQTWLGLNEDGMSAYGTNNVALASINAVLVLADTNNNATNTQVFLVGAGAPDTDDAGFSELFRVDADATVHFAGTIEDGTWGGSIIGEAYGGTGQSSYAAGDLLYATGATALAKLAAGSDGQHLELSGGLPVWADPPSGTLSGLTDTTITTVGAGEILYHNGSAWINRTFAEADIATDTDLDAHVGDTANPHSVTKSQVGLGNVENTALSTWGGSTSITTLGTIGTGTWQGTAISSTYLGSHTHAAGDITSGTLASARLSGSYTGITAVGTLTSLGVDNGGGHTLDWAVTADITHTLPDGSPTLRIEDTTAAGGVGLYFRVGTLDWVVGLDGSTGEFRIMREGADLVTVDSTGAFTQGEWQGTAIASTYLGAHTHAASDINSGTFADARISEPSVTQHEAALSIGWSQVTGTPTTFSGYGIVDGVGSLSDVTITTVGAGEVLEWSGTAWINRTLAEAGIAATGHTHAAGDVTSGTFADARISQSSVTQHEGALSIGWSQVTSTPTTFSGYGIVDGIGSLSDVTITSVGAGEILEWSGSAWINQTLAEAGIAAASHTHPWSDITSTPTTLSGYGITDGVSTSRTVGSGTGLSGGGDLSADRTLALDINSLTAQGTPTGSTDYVVIYDAGLAGHRKVLLDDLPGGLADTDELPEGSTNLYYTDARVDARLDTFQSIGALWYFNVGIRATNADGYQLAGLGSDPTGTSGVGKLWARTDGTLRFRYATSGIQTVEFTGHTHTASDISDFDSSVDARLDTQQTISANWFFDTLIRTTSADGYQFAGLASDPTGSGGIGKLWARTDGTLRFRYATSGIQTVEFTGHTHTASDISDFDSSVDARLDTQQTISANWFFDTLIRTTSADGYQFAGLGADPSGSTSVGKLWARTDGTLRFRYGANSIQTVEMTGHTHTASDISDLDTAIDDRLDTAQAIAAFWQFNDDIRSNSTDGYQFGGIASDPSGSSGVGKLWARTDGSLRFRYATSGIQTVEFTGHTHTASDISDLDTAIDARLDTQQTISANWFFDTLIRTTSADGYQFAGLGADPSGSTSVGKLWARTDGTLRFRYGANSIQTVEMTGHTHTASDVTDFNSSVDSRLDTNQNIAGDWSFSGDVYLTGANALQFADLGASPSGTAGRLTLWHDGTALKYRVDTGTVQTVATTAGSALNDLSDVTITSVASGELLGYNGSAWVNRTLAEAGVAADSHTHPTSDITSGTFADARIAQSNVTQHEGALSIGASQVTSGTLALARGGTGASLVDPNADRLLFWDDSAGAIAFLTPGDGLSITATSMAVDINGLTADASPDGAADYVMTYDASATAHKKVLLDNLPGGGASTLGGLSDVNTTGVADGEVLTYNSTSGDWEPAAGGGGLTEEQVLAWVVAL